jgi:hypothetical protein
MTHNHLLSIISKYVYSDSQDHLWLFDAKYQGSAPLAFFSGTDNSSILNRFTQDMQLIDKQLPSALANLGNR